MSRTPGAARSRRHGAFGRRSQALLEPGGGHGGPFPGPGFRRLPARQGVSLHLRNARQILIVNGLDGGRQLASGRVAPGDELRPLNVGRVDRQGVHDGVGRNLRHVRIGFQDGELMPADLRGDREQRTMNLGDASHAGRLHHRRELFRHAVERPQFGHGSDDHADRPGGAGRQLALDSEILLAGPVRPGTCPSGRHADQRQRRDGSHHVTQRSTHDALPDHTSSTDHVQAGGLTGPAPHDVFEPGLTGLSRKRREGQGCPTTRHVGLRRGDKALARRQYHRRHPARARPDAGTCLNV